MVLTFRGIRRGVEALHTSELQRPDAFRRIGPFADDLPGLTTPQRFLYPALRLIVSLNPASALPRQTSGLGGLLEGRSDKTLRVVRILHTLSSNCSQR